MPLELLMPATSGTDSQFSTDLKILKLCSFNEQAYTVCLQHCAVSVVLVFC